MKDYLKYVGADKSETRSVLEKLLESHNEDDTGGKEKGKNASY